jgi:peptide/nickel transport system permease protein
VTATVPPRARWIAPLARMILLRVAGTVAILLVISVLVFGMLYLAPGDLVKNLIGNKPATPEVIAAIRAQYHLDDPLYLQYWRWLTHALGGDFGQSVRMQAPVIDVIAARTGLTLALCALAFGIAVIVAVPLGVVSAVRPDGWLDRSVTSVSLVGLSAPSFAIGLLLLYAFAYYLPIFPVYGGGEAPLDTLYHLVLPSIALALGLGGILMRLTRTTMLRELDADYILFARARGMRESRVNRLALRNAAIPITTSAGLVLTYLVGGTILVETIFAIPGLGTLLESSVLYKDIAVVQALTLMVALLIAAITLLVDLSYLLLDPRVRAKELGR